MVRVPIRVKAISPLSLNVRRRSGQILETARYLPAPTLRGAFAGQLLRQSRAKYERFFQSVEQVRFSDLYPVPPFTYFDERGSAVPVPLPLTAVTCKHHAGFLSQQRYAEEERHERPNEHPRHGVFDLLLKHLVYSHIPHPQKPLLVHCPTCGSGVPAERYEGHYQFEGRFPWEPDDGRVVEPLFLREEASTYYLTRTAINRYSGTAQEKQLYTTEVVAEETVFLGTVDLPDEATLRGEALAELSRWARIGGDANVGLGQMEVTVFEDHPQPLTTGAAIRQRIESFNAQLKTVAAQMQAEQGQAEGLKGVFFSVDLRSDAILTGPYGEPTLILRGEDLSSRLSELHQGFAACPVALCAPAVPSFTVDSTLCAGWSAAWQMPKEVRLAVRRGSVFVFHVEALTDELCAALAALENSEGIGERQEEGLGRVTVCHPFHWEVEPV